MGKPSLRKTSSSSESLNSISSKNLINKMSSRKNGKRNKKKQDRMLSKSIQKLFHNLREELEGPMEPSISSIIDTDVDETVITIDDSHIESPLPKKRKIEDDTNPATKIPKLENPCIIIKDDDYNTPRKAPNIHCSTPNTNIKSPVECNISNVYDLTKEINSASFLTIDLTTESRGSVKSGMSLDGGSTPNTVIDLEKSEVTDTNQNTVIDLEDQSECSLVSVSNIGSASLSGESDVTVISKGAGSKKMNKFVRGIANMNAEEKGRLLELITQKIFNGCNVASSSSWLKNKPKPSRLTETAEDAYIKEVILSQTQSRNSIGSNIYNPEKDLRTKSALRMVVIDGSNVAMEHGKGRQFSVKGLKICIEYFVRRGHIVKAFVPRFRCKFGKSSDPRLLDSLERRGLVVYTPSREVQGKLITSYDDRYIVQCAAEFEGVIVSGDNFRDLLQENPRWRFVIENRLLPFTWVDDMIMFPKDPLGRNGPSLEKMLKR